MVKILEVEDFNKIREVLINIYIKAYRELEEYAYTKRSDIKSYFKWLYRLDNHGLLIAQDNKDIKGFLFFCHNWWDKIYGEIGEIHELAVLPEYQGKGIGSALVKKSIRLMKKYHNIFGLWVGENNEKAKRFYKKMGFSYDGKVGKWIRMIRKELSLS